MDTKNKKPVIEQDQFIDDKHNYSTVSDEISNVVLTEKFKPGWILGFLIAASLLMMLMFSAAWLLYKGVGVWGINMPIGWGFAIINFVWWIGIGHAGTFISAILLLVRQDWRTSINRFAEAMTLFAVACAGMYPLLHLGRVNKFYWLFPYPSIFGIWPQFRSPLVWDVIAVSTYATVSLLFWYVGLVPDLASFRDRAKNKIAKVVYGMASLGWRGSAKHWLRYETAYLLLAGLAAPLVISVHTIVGLDFAAGIIPGWHATIFPPYFVAGAIFAGFAMVLTLSIPIRKFYNLKDFITDKHLENMAKIVLATGMIVVYGYFMEVFSAWYSGNPYEQFMMKNRMMGPYAPFYWALIICNGVVPQFLWLKSMRTNTYVLFAISLVIAVGMWLERFIIVVTSLHRDFLPSSWGMYSGTFWDWSLFIGTIGLFLTLLFLFIRVLPMISMSEMKMLIKDTKKKKKK